MQSTMPQGRPVYFSSVNQGLLILIFITSSFDIFLNFKIGGFSLRFSYLLIGLFLGLNSIKILARSFYLRFLGLGYFLIWSFFLLLFVFNTTLPGRNIGYLLWHLIHFLLIIFFTNSMQSPEAFQKLFKAYVISFVVMAAMGMVQFCLGVVGINFFVVEWWFAHLPRVNGFSYEPSYYATYIIIGWTISFSLLTTASDIFRPKIKLSFFLLMTASILLSTSRMGILFMVVVCSIYFCRVALRSVRRMRMNTWQFYFSSFFASLLIMSFFIIVPLILTKYQFLLSGTGIAGQSAHSAGRFDIMKKLLEIFWSRPFTGVSLGGIPSAIGAYEGVPVHTLEQAKLSEGINIFLEVLVASGIVGFIFFMMYLINLFLATSRLKTKLYLTNKKSYPILNALILALTVELLILCFNQNILRLYLWVHIAMLNSAYFIYRKELQDQTNKTA